MVTRKTIVAGVAAAPLLLLSAGCVSAKEKLAAGLDTVTVVASRSAASPVATTRAPVPTQVQEAQSTATPTIPVTLTAKPLFTPSANASDLQLAIVDGDKDVSLVAHDGSGKKKLLSSEQCPKPTKLIWSPTGNKLACLNYEHIETRDERTRSWSFSRYTVAIVDTEGRVLGKIGPVESFAWSFSWSPAGQHIAYGVVASTTPQPVETYYIADYTGKTVVQLQGGERWLTNDLLQGIQGNLVWSPDGSVLAYNADSGRAAIYDMNTKSKRDLGKDTDRPLAWVLGGKGLLVASNYDVGYLLPRYEANLLDLATGQLTRVPELDNSNRFWLSPDGNSAAFLFKDRPRQIFAGLAMLDFTSLAVTPIANAIIRYGSETIPYNHAAFSRDGSFLYWADMAGGADIYRARTNGTETTKLASLPWVGSVSFALDLTKMAYISPGNPATLWISNLDGSGAVEIGPRFPFAWRP